MKQEITWSDNVDHLKRALAGEGVFLVVLDKNGRANSMTIGWGEVGIIWSRPVFTVLVRRSRYTYDCLLSADSFTVNVPSTGQLEEELLFCGTKSGRDLDKAAACGLTLIAAREVSSPIIEECAFTTSALSWRESSLRQEISLLPRFWSSTMTRMTTT
jgi:flavin reductase (DIM6/NTAB) family NADH-FMN oxidoreductase RutF